MMRKDGTLLPKSFIWEDGEKYHVDKVLHITPAASLKVGGRGIRYTVKIGGAERYMFREEDRWFVEARSLSSKTWAVLCRIIIYNIKWRKLRISCKNNDPCPAWTGKGLSSFIKYSLYARFFKNVRPMRRFGTKKWRCLLTFNRFYCVLYRNNCFFMKNIAFFSCFLCKVCDIL